VSGEIARETESLLNSGNIVLESKFSVV